MERTLRIFPSTVENLFIGPRLHTRGAIGRLRERKPPNALKKDYEDGAGWRVTSIVAEVESRESVRSGGK